MPKCILAEQGGKGGGGAGGVVLKSIEVTKPPAKTSYLAGDQFDPTGMVISASYGIGSTILATVEATGYSINPTTLVDGVTKVTITYSEMGETCTTELPITVIHKLTEISIVTNPTKVAYEYGDTLNTAGMVVKATYSDGATANVTGFTYSPTSLTTVNSALPITVSYVENEVTKTTNFNVNVERKSVAKPTWKSNLTYNTQVQSVTGIDKWNNFNTTYMTIGGTTSATNAGTYKATFTLGANYRWADGSTSVLEINWTINKAAGSFSLSSTSVTINGSNYSSGVTVTAQNPTGTISATSSNNSACPVFVSGNNIVIKGNGSTEGTFTITVSCAASINYTAPANKTITVTAAYWTWGAENGNADAAWWAGLKNALPNMNNTELASYVGKTKSVTLTTAILGTTTHLVRCVGYNVHRDKNNPTKNTLTFETANCLAQITVFSSSNAKWFGSTVRQQCINYYNAFPGKASVATVSIGTATATNRNQNETPTYTDETAFLFSDAEHGYSAGGDVYTCKGFSASYNEFDKQNTFKTVPQYYASAPESSLAIRIKKLGDLGSANHYWERSLYYIVEGYACIVGCDGRPADSYYDSRFGLAPAFVI